MPAPKFPALSLHDLSGVPFHVEVGTETLKFAPPTVLFFEKLLSQYNLRAVDVQTRPGTEDQVQARLDIVKLIMKMMHVGLDMANPDDGWTMDRVALLVQLHPEVIERYQSTFVQFMPSKKAAKKP